jgi:hypothetical protein
MFVLVNACLCEINQHQAQTQWLCPSDVLSNVLKIMTKPRRVMSVLAIKCRGFCQRGDAGVLAAVKLSNRALLSKKIVKK